MKRFKTIVWTAMLCLGVGCAVPPGATQDVSEPEAATGQVEQDIGGGGGSCPAKDNCYWLCRFRFKCTSPSTCNQLSQCLNQCDAEFPTCS